MFGQVPKVEDAAIYQTVAQMVPDYDAPIRHLFQAHDWARLARQVCLTGKRPRSPVTRRTKGNDVRAPIRMVDLQSPFPAELVDRGKRLVPCVVREQLHEFL